MHLPLRQNFPALFSHTFLEELLFFSFGLSLLLDTFPFFLKIPFLMSGQLV